MKIPKTKALEICQRCPRWFQFGCIYTDIESSKIDEINPPECMQTQLPNLLQNQSNQLEFEYQKQDSFSSIRDYSSYSTGYERGMPTYDNGRNQIKVRELNSSPRPSPYEKLRPSRYSVDGKTLDGLDLKILEFVELKYHERGIVRITKSKRRTIRTRLKRLERLGLIKPKKQNNGLSNVKLYSTTPKWARILAYNEGDTIASPKHAPFTAHMMSFKFPLLEGTQPKSIHSCKMRNWTAYDFKQSNHIIRTTPSSIIVFINVDLGADTIDNLNHKYAKLAEAFAREFANKHQIKIGAPKRYREPHYTIKDSALATLLVERGELLTQSGIKIDKSHSTGDLEMKEETAKAFEYTLNQLPKIVSELPTEIKAEIQAGFKEIKEALWGDSAPQNGISSTIPSILEIKGHESREGHECMYA